MLDTQVLKDQQGMPMGVFIPMKTWEKDFIDLRLNKAQRHPECLKPVEMLLETL